jgi:hypothetical protein
MIHKNSGPTSQESHFRLLSIHKPVNVVHRNYRCLFYESYETHKCTVGKYGAIFNVKSDVAYEFLPRFTELHVDSNIHYTFTMSVITSSELCIYNLKCKVVVLKRNN